MAENTFDLLKTAVIVLIVAGVVGAVGLDITSTMEESQFDTDSVDDEVHTVDDQNTPVVVTVDNTPTREGVQDGSLTVTNTTGTELTTPDNYTVISWEDGKFNFTDVTNWTTGSEDLNFSYTYFVGTAASNASGETIEGVTEITSYFPTIGIAVAAANVIGIIINYLSKRRR